MSPPHGLMFHHFHGGHHPASQGSMSAGQLDDLIGFVGKDNLLPADEWLRRALSGTLKDGDLCLTFDDNLRCQYDVALPVLRAHGLTAFWFVYTSVLQGNIEPLEIYRAFRTVHFDGIDDFYDAFFNAVHRSTFADDVTRALKHFNPMTYLAPYPFYSDADRRFRFVRDQALGPARYHRIMDAMIAAAGIDIADTARGLWMDDACLVDLQETGHVIGLHSHTHPTRLAELSAADQEREYVTNFEHLTQLLRQPPMTMSHPCNSYDDETLRILKRLGIRLGFRSNMAEIAAADPLEHPREDHANLLAEMTR